MVVDRLAGEAVYYTMPETRQRKKHIGERQEAYSMYRLNTTTEG